MWLNHFVQQINEDGTNHTLWVKWFWTEPRPFVKPPPKSALAVARRAVVALCDFNLRVLLPYLPVLGWGAVRTVGISALAMLMIPAWGCRCLDADFAQPPRARPRNRLC
jgi:hypothetical protein